MPSLKQRGSRLIYVAGSARQLRAEVQEWLGRADHGAVASANVYDALALLAMGRKPDALIVSMDAVDWNEMDFFDQAAWLSDKTRIYVTGHDHHQEKIDAACQRGARRFDADELSAYLADNQAEVLADQIQTAPSPAPLPARAGQGSAGWRGGGSLLAGSLTTVRSPAGPAPDLGQPPTGLGKGQIERSAMASGAIAGGPDAGGPSDEAKWSPRVRLVRAEEQEPAQEPQEQEGPTIVFPWSPSQDRPKRTPPPSAVAPAGEGEAGRDTVPGTVELTREELAALMGGPPKASADPPPGRDP